METKELENDFELSKNVFEIEMMSTVWVLDTACDPMNNLALLAVGTNDAVTVINANDSRIIKVKSENTEFAEDHCEDARFDVESDYCDCLAFSPKIEGNKLYLAYADDVKLYIKTIYITQDENKHVEYMR